jgi:hypothetical protein
MTEERTPLDVVVEAEAPEAEQQALVEVFRNVGVTAEVRPSYLRLSADVLPWIVNFIAPMKWVGLAFASGFAAKGGADSWDAFRDEGWRGVVRMVREISAVHGDREGTVTVRDPDGPDVHLDLRIPEAAYPELSELDWQGMSDGWLYWNPQHEEWWFLQGHRAPTGIPAPRRDPNASGS